MQRGGKKKELEETYPSTNNRGLIRVMGLLGGFFLFLFSKSSVMIFILPLFKLSIQICLIALFSTAVLRLPGGFGSEWEERGGVRASKQNCPRRLCCPPHQLPTKRDSY